MTLEPEADGTWPALQSFSYELKLSWHPFPVFPSRVGVVCPAVDGRLDLPIPPVDKLSANSRSDMKSYAALRRPRWIVAVLLFCGFVWLTFDVFHPPPPPPFGYGQGHWLPHPHSAEANSTNRWRAERIRAAFIHTYDNYLEHAFPNDELRPLTGRNSSTLNGWGVTFYDSLDTMWIMRLPDYLEHAVEYLSHVPTTSMSLFDQKPNAYAPFFETVIRYLGGLLSAYAMTGHRVFLDRADELGTMLLPAMNTPSGLPMYGVNTLNGQTRGGWMAGTLWAEAMSCQMEFKYLAHVTGKREYFDKVEAVMQLMEDANNHAGTLDEEYAADPKQTQTPKYMVEKGVFPTIWDPKTGLPRNRLFSAGAFADSAHEYLLKQYLLTAQSEPRAISLYLDAVDAIMNKLLYHSSVRDFIYVTDIDSVSGKPSHTFEHLTCFLPGMLRLGVHSLKLPAEKKQRHLWAAQGLAKTCWLTYADMPTGIGPDEIIVNGSNARLWLDVLAESPTSIPGLSEVVPEQDRAQRGYRIKRSSYLLRPEALETFYIMWKLGEGDVWRERGWTVFEAIEKHARTKWAYASIVNVDVQDEAITLKDELPSYFLAETLKYLYLMFDETIDLPFESWVFTTEAHPLPIFEWSKVEKERYGIPL
ncbi:seven-hairpin glycosidase [Hymenopellis radicata]|nr:seven-hairpin glycosidase [Hymenopellis radicata]